MKPGKLEVLDIDDTFCAAHGGQQLAFWNAHHDERGFASMHIYHVASGTPVVAILRPARTPKGSEVRTVIRHVTKRLRRHWPKARIVWRGDSHYGRVEAMEWAEDDDADYIFGLAGNAALDALVAETAVNLRFHHAMSSKAKLRTYASFLYQAGSWKRPDGDDYEHDFQRAQYDARHIRTIMDGSSGGHLEPLVGGLSHLAHRAGSDRRPLVDERSCARIGLTRSGIPSAVAGNKAGRKVHCHERQDAGPAANAPGTGDRPALLGRQRRPMVCPGGNVGRPMPG